MTNPEGTTTRQYAGGRTDIVKDGARIISSERFDKKRHGWPLHQWIKWGTYLDLRGDLIVHSTAAFGNHVMIITASHLYDGKGLGRRFLRKVWIDAHSFIASGTILYHCWVKEHAIVSVGAVVRNAVVPAWSVVEGNPARIIGRFSEERKQYVRFEDGHTEEMERF